MSKIIYRFKCLNCGISGTATTKINLPCTDCGGVLEYKMIIPQGTDETAPNAGGSKP